MSKYSLIFGVGAILFGIGVGGSNDSFWLALITWGIMLCIYAPVAYIISKL